MSTALVVSGMALGKSSLLVESDELAASLGKAGRLGGEQRGKSRSLEVLIVDTWEGLVRGTSQCPVCGGRMEPEYGAHARPVGGRCASCGSALH